MVRGRVFKGLCLASLMVLSGLGTIEVTAAPGEVWERAVRPQAPGAIELSDRSYHDSVAFDNKLWVIGGGIGSDSDIELLNDVWSSEDGSSWDRVVETAPFSARDGHCVVSFNNKLWVIGGSDSGGWLNDIWSSVDGVNWLEETSSANFASREYFSCFVHNNKMWVIGGRGVSGITNDVWSSSDGVSWTQETSNAAFTPRWGHSSCSYNNKMWTIAGDAISVTKSQTIGQYSTTVMSGNNDVWSSPDGITWTQETNVASFPERYQSDLVVLDGKMWILCGTRLDDDLMYGPTAVTYNDAWSSSDGVTWTQAITPMPFRERMGHSCSVLNNRLYMIHGRKTIDYYSYDKREDVWSTTDGENWDHESGLATFPKRMGASSEIFNGEMVIIGGYNLNAAYSNDIYSTTNGYTWKKMASDLEVGNRYLHSTASFDSKLWVIGGNQQSGHLNDVWYSEDATNWTEATDSAGFEARTGHASVDFDGKLWVIGGNAGYPDYRKNDVWSSVNGTDWIEVTDSAPFSAREYHGLVVFDNKLWVIGGSLGHPDYQQNDVWYSSDGLNWTQATDIAGFTPRDNFACTVASDKIWVIGGSDGYAHLDDVWSSPDGINWTQVTDDAQFGKVSGHNAHVWNGALWAIEQRQPNSELNNVWYSDLEITLGLSADALDFDVRDIDGGPTAPQTTVLSNQSDGSINVTNVTIQNDPQGNFAVTTTVNKASLLAGGSMDINVTFNPSSAGSKTATLVIESDDSENPTLNVPLTGEAVLDYTVAYTAGSNGAIDGTATQLVNHGDNAAIVEAIPSSGYDFFDWSDGSTDNPRQDMSVTTNISVTASFVESNTIVDWSMY